MEELVESKFFTIKVFRNRDDEVLTLKFRSLRNAFCEKPQPFLEESQTSNVIEAVIIAVIGFERGKRPINVFLSEIFHLNGH